MKDDELVGSAAFHDQSDSGKTEGPACFNPCYAAVWYIQISIDRFNLSFIGPVCDSVLLQIDCTAQDTSVEQAC